MKFTIAILAVALLAVPAFAQEGGDEEEFNLAEALQKVSELLKKAETSLIESIQPGKPSDDSMKAASEAKRAMEELLKDSEKNGREAVDLMTEILKKAPRGGGGGGGQQEEKPQDGEKKERDSQRQPKSDELDPGNSSKEPKNPKEQHSKPESTAKKPPESEKGKGSKPDPRREWLAFLPAELRGRFKNMDLEDIPPQWRKIIEAYRKRLADLDSGGDGD